jgi:hypothetical protein
MTEYQEVCKSQMGTDETASAEDVKDISNRVLFDQVISKQDEKENETVKDELSSSDQDQRVEALDDVQQVLLLSITTLNMVSRPMIHRKYMLAYL